MIKFENTEVMGWEHAIRGMRNPMNSWDKSDSYLAVDCNKCGKIEREGVCNKENRDCTGFECYEIGPNDLDLMKHLRNAGTDHRKFMRMITVYVDITAPLYWWAEMDTYRIGVEKNSCSFMHKGVSKEYSIHDFSVKDSRIYEILSPLKHEVQVSPPVVIPEGDFKYWFDTSGLRYRVYENGCIIREEYSYIDTWKSDRQRVLPEVVCPEHIPKNGSYIQVVMNRHNGSTLKHRIIAEAWIDNPEHKPFVNHKDGNKQNNCVSNLEWVTSLENNQHAQMNNLRNNVSSLHRKYQSWKSQNKVVPLEQKSMFWYDCCINKLTYTQLAEKYNITSAQATNVRYGMQNNENTELFLLCYQYEQLIKTLNHLRDIYLTTKDSQIFQQIRCLMPQGYLQKRTVMLNYEVLANIYESRKNHKLDEWSIGFINWINTLPYSKLITGE